MTGWLDSALGIHEEALGLRARRLDLIASNIANAATPGYKARDLDFAALIAGETSADADPLYRVPLQVAPDGNSVELVTEQAAFAENAVAYRATLSFLSGRVSTLMSALKGE